MAGDLVIESILSGVKRQLGIVDKDESFDEELVIHINSTFAILYQLGVGPDAPFQITGYDETWDQFIDQGDIEFVRTYVYLKVRLLFDPPQTATMYEALSQHSKELEWRLNVAAENASTT